MLLQGREGPGRGMARQRLGQRRGAVLGLAEGVPGIARHQVAAEGAFVWGQQGQDVQLDGERQLPRGGAAGSRPCPDDWSKLHVAGRWRCIGAPGSLGSLGVRLVARGVPGRAPCKRVTELEVFHDAMLPNPTHITDGCSSKGKE